MGLGKPQAPHLGRRGGGGAYFILTFPCLGALRSPCDTPRQARCLLPGGHNTCCLCSDLLLSWGLRVPRQQKHLLCSLTLPGRLRAAFLSHLPPPLTSSLFCNIPLIKQIFCSVSTCHTPCQAVRRIPGSLVMWYFLVGSPRVTWGRVRGTWVRLPLFGW